jgi:hypothetical protein
MMQQDEAVSVDAKAAPGGAVIVQIDGKLGAELVGKVLGQLWWSSFWSAAALIGLAGTLVFLYITINTVNVLQYDLFDLRAKTGQAHENTPEAP